MADVDDEKSITSCLHDYRKLGDEHVLRVEIESSLQRTVFYVPISKMLEREIEMRETASLSQMGAEKWSGSRLFLMWQTNPRRSLDEEILLCLEPEASLKDYCEIQWKPWLTSCIREFYSSGTIRVPDDVLGSDILMALEYFGIVTSSPEAFTFETPQALGRIKIWSAYFTHRHTLARWIVSQHEQSPEVKLRWISTPDVEDCESSETRFEINGGAASILGRETSAGVQNDDLPSCQLLHFLFFDKESTNRLSQETPIRIRRDFCSYLGRMLTDVDISFDVERVKISNVERDHVVAVLRAVLRVEPFDCENPATDNAETFFVGTETSSFVPVQPGFLPIVQTDEGSENQNAHGTRSERILVSGSLSDSSNQPNQSGDITNTRDFCLAQPVLDDSRPLEAEKLSAQEDHSEKTERSFEGGMSKEYLENFRQIKATMIGGHQLSRDVPSMPVGYINTEFGDLQSVTSALSNPKMDDSTVASDSDVISPQERRRNLLDIPEAVDEKEAFAEEEVISTADPSRQKNPEEDDPLDTGIVAEKEQFDDGNLFQTKIKNEYTGICGFFDGLLDSMCTAIAGPANVASKESPNERNTARTKLQPNAGKKVQDIRIDGKKGHDGMNKRTVGTGNTEPVTPDWLDAACASEYRMSELVDSRTAESMGRSLVNNLDEIAKCAFDESNDDQRIFTNHQWQHTQRDIAIGSGQPDNIKLSTKQAQQLAQCTKRNFERPRAVPVHNVAVLPPRESRQRLRLKEQQKMGIARKKKGARSFDHPPPGLMSRANPHDDQVGKFATPQHNYPQTYQRNGRRVMML